MILRNDPHALTVYSRPHRLIRHPSVSDISILTLGNGLAHDIYRHPLALVSTHAKALVYMTLFEAREDEALTACF